MKKIIQLCSVPTEYTYKGVTSMRYYKEFVEPHLKNEQYTKPCLQQHLFEKSDKKIDGPLMDLILRMLTMDHTKRISSKEALAHPFFKDSPSLPLLSLDPATLVPTLPPKDEHEYDVRLENR